MQAVTLHSNDDQIAFTVFPKRLSLPLTVMFTKPSAIFTLAASVEENIEMSMGIQE